MEKKIIESASREAYKYVRIYKSSLFESGIGQRLPPEYKKFYKEWKEDTPKPVHYIPERGKWKLDETTGEIKRIENIPLPAFLTPELHKVFTGGEEIIFGYIKKKQYIPRNPRFWMPSIQKNVVYSEILDKYLSVLMTKRVIGLIHEHEGFENYLFQNKACDLKNLIALKLKRLLLLKLADKDLPYNNEKNEIIFEKYRKYLIPREEIEWYGLSFSEACKKQENIEAKLKFDSIIPLKQIYRKNLIEELEMKKGESD